MKSEILSQGFYTFTISGVSSDHQLHNSPPIQLDNSGFRILTMYKKSTSLLLHTP